MKVIAMTKRQTPDIQPLLVELPFKVKSYDIDHFRHVNNQVYIRWLEDLRHHFMDMYLPFDELLDEGIAPIITSTEIHYKRGIHLFEEPIGYLWVNDLSRAIFTLGAEFRVNGGVTTWAVQRGVFADIESMKILRIPDLLKDRYDAEQETR